MISCEFLVELEKNISIGKQNIQNEPTFGGLNILLCRDFHRFPPVAAPNDGLYMPAQPGHDKLEQCVGQTLYEELSTVVILKEQMRVDIEMLRGQIVKHTNDPGATNFDTERWNNVSLVTPQHRVHRAWNEMALQKHCHKTQGRIYICCAEDTVKGAELNLAEEYAMALRTKNETKSDLPETVSFAIGACVMVVQNINTDLDLANGAHGTIVDIILRPDK
ncbi:hypothetical protein BT96DRAFT_953836 [Gymnopus androsaceus JB14]|uniref:DNA helicase n=1 Tax=Gymnopus androsaceus JB14 TaxID=1447944 RepID=A0A6A4IGF0_9AGAR|nr:hypothetical protein BT96DRAFT_953836 [Gymnopus androsaceus JB14]